MSGDEPRVDTSVDLGGLVLRNPVLTASGTFGYGSEFAPFLDLRRLGGFVSKSLTVEPRTGNLPARIAETPGGMLNAIGLENVGAEAFAAEKLPLIPDGVPVVASLFGTEVNAYVEVAKRLTGVPKVAAFEVNASCPHVKAGGIEFGQDPRLLAELLQAIRKATPLPVIAKLSPNVTSIAEMARVCEAEGADAISLINTLQALDLDLETRRPLLRNVLGGLSGPAIRPVALRMVWQAYRAVSLPICGIGGILSTEDALKFMVCGATAIQVGTASYLNPMAAAEIAEGMERWAAERGIGALRDLIGTLEAD